MTKTAAKRRDCSIGTVLVAVPAHLDPVFEDELHRLLGVALGEDPRRTAAGFAGPNLGLVRRVAVLLQQEGPGMGGRKAERPDAALDDA